MSIADPYKDPSGATLLEWRLNRIIFFFSKNWYTRVVEKQFPWGIILLMGGGFALAEGASKSCLTHLVSGILPACSTTSSFLYKYQVLDLDLFKTIWTQVGSVLSSLSSLPPSLILLLLCLITSAISQIASNSATTSMLVMLIGLWFFGHHSVHAQHYSCLIKAPVVLSMASPLHLHPVSREN